ncbi:protein bottleneck [Drosophila bipectinata]|uniref:protein bottleneck n=1 Tax=Drosophila bipectinata TaxID=42026 RepID=UPI001C8A0704|nr:protein bottleneck [Drosophila bipectinata]
MSISTFNFQFYNYKLQSGSPSLATSSGFGSASRSINSTSFISELEMDIDEEMTPSPAITSTPKPRFTTELALELSKSEPTEPPALRPKLHTAQKRWSMELREKVLEMSKRNNASDGEEKPQTTVGQEQPLQQQPQQGQENDANTPTVSDKINFFNKLTNTFQSNNKFLAPGNSQTNRFISLLRSSRPQALATCNSNNTSNHSLNGSTVSGGSAAHQVPPPKPKRLGAAGASTQSPISSYQFATPMGVGKGGSQRKCSLRRKPSMDKSRATISRQNSSATVRPQHHAIMEDLSLVVPVRMRIAEYEQRISMSA